jgi:hypothetical protein
MGSLVSCYYWQSLSIAISTTTWIYLLFIFVFKLFCWLRPRSLQFRAEIEEFMRFAWPAGRAGIPSQNAAQKQPGWARITSQNYRQEFRASQQAGPESPSIWPRGLYKGRSLGPIIESAFQAKLLG